MVSLISAGPISYSSSASRLCLRVVVSAVAGILVCPGIRSRVRKTIIKHAVGALGSICGISAVIACTMPLTLVSFVGVPRPMWF